MFSRTGTYHFLLSCGTKLLFCPFHAVPSPKAQFDIERKKKWVSTDLSVGCSEKTLKSRTNEIVAEFYEAFLTGSVTKVDKKSEAVAADPNGNSELQLQEFYMDLLNINAANKFDLPKIKRFEANFYTKEELDELFEVFKGDRIELAIHIAAYYGLRKSEIIGLKWDSIDFEAGTITVRRRVSSTYGTGKEVIRVDNELKTKASERTFPLIPHIEHMLRERKLLEEHYSKLLGKKFDRKYDGFVCRDNFGKFITPNFVTDHFKRVITRNKLKKIRFHDLRHSCASLLPANGASMKAIQDWLGHSTFNVTAKFYSHLDPRSKEESAATIAKVLGGESARDRQDKDNEDEKNRKSPN